MQLNLTPAQWKAKAREEVGDVSKNHTFELRLPIAISGGTWRAFFNGVATNPIPYNASAALLADALNALDTVGASGFSVSGLPKGPYYAEAGNAIGAFDLHGFLTTDSDLVPASAVTVADYRIGQPSKYAADTETLWTAMEDDDVPFQIRYLVCKIEIGKKRLGALLDQVDTRDRDYEEKRSQRVKEARLAVTEAQNALGSIEANSSVGGFNAALTGKVRRFHESILDSRFCDEPNFRRYGGQNR